jgi:hypothetical protein
MQIARLAKEKSVADLVTKVYGLKPGDSRATVAEKTLLAANPQLNNIEKLPAGTPVVVPVIAGVSTQSSAITDPQRAVWMSVVDKLLDSAQQASNAQVTGLATTAPPTPDSARTASLTQLRKDIAQFKKLHSS